MNTETEERNRRIAELEVMALRMEEQIEMAESTIREGRRNIAALREQIKLLKAADVKTDGFAEECGG